jgi:hypothetical protein
MRDGDVLPRGFCRTKAMPRLSAPFDAAKAILDGFLPPSPRPLTLSLSGSAPVRNGVNPRYVSWPFGVDLPENVRYPLGSSADWRDNRDEWTPEIDRATSRKPVSSRPAGQRSASAAGVSDAGGDRQAHEGGARRALRAPGCHNNFDRLPTWTPGNRDLRPRMVAN